MIRRPPRSTLFPLHDALPIYAYLIPENCLVFVFAYMALVKYLPIFKMATIVNLYRQMLTGVRLQVHVVSIKLAQTMIKII